MNIIKTKFELFTLNIANIWDPVEDKNFWEATIEAPDICSLFDLHLFIQSTINFGDDHLFEFYAGRNYRNRKIIFSEESGHPDDDNVYDIILLKDVYALKGLKLYYLFDFGDNWLFEIKKSRKTAIPLNDTEYPRVVTENGIKLRQYLDYE
jgi:hypothetical protein